ncbi:hypothetical protein [Mucilaginibacter segetis]|uniref:Uncharacterized protein n=1 Tax=Mucilaginibacter segetis TaxID=2793071 RepID=A0A934PVZ5_9SPHI|nr:hypothetical protein [Mucilaginibacter segetis]MBK0380135.1 hypothetical protein [Mucilaginibacter segetis]
MKVNSDNKRSIDLDHVDPEDIGEVLIKIEQSFNINLEDTSLKEVKTFGKLCDVVIDKVKKTNTDSCTTQQAFYKLRHAITESTGFDKERIKPQTRLSELFPRDSRIEAISGIEEEMGFQLNLLKPKQWVVTLFVLVIIGSIITLFYNLSIGLSGLLIGIVGLRLAGRFGKEMSVKTIGDLAEKISREHYLKCRRDASTINKNEVSQKIKQLFVKDLELNTSRIEKQSTLF